MDPTCCGTGPSLAKAIDYEWNNGYRIVSNTIVRDPILWEHIKPHFFVAGDPIYHFGHTEFSSRFRNDLLDRFKKLPAYFLYPAIYDFIVRREFYEFLEWLIPIPISLDQYEITGDLSEKFQLPSLGNVLNLASSHCYFSK